MKSFRGFILIIGLLMTSTACAAERFTLNIDNRTRDDFDVTLNPAGKWKLTTKHKQPAVVKARHTTQLLATGPKMLNSVIILTSQQSHLTCSIEIKYKMNMIFNFQQQSNDMGCKFDLTTFFNSGQDKASIIIK